MSSDKAGGLPITTEVDCGTRALTSSATDGSYSVALAGSDQVFKAAGHRRTWSRTAHALLEVAYPTAFSIITIAVWQLVDVIFRISPGILPAPSAIVGALISHWQMIAGGVLPTVEEIVYGFLGAVIGGVVVAIVITAVPIIEKMIYPLLVGALVIPKVAVAPLFVVWFGFGLEPKVIIVVLIAFFPIVVDMTLGLRSVPDNMLVLVSSMGASKWKAFWKVRFRSSLPNLFVGLKVSMALAVVGAIVAEFVQSSEGLGYLLISAYSNLETPVFFAVLLVLTCVGVFLYSAIDILERLILKRGGAK